MNWESLSTQCARIWIESTIEMVFTTERKRLQLGCKRRVVQPRPLGLNRGPVLELCTEPSFPWDRVRRTPWFHLGPLHQRRGVRPSPDLGWTGGYVLLTATRERPVKPLP